MKTEPSDKDKKGPLPKAGAKAGAKAVAKPDASAKKTEKRKTGLEMSSIMSQAKKIKLEYNAATTSANSLVERISNDQKWRWASHETINGDLMQAKGELEAAVGASSFVKEALTTGDLGDLKSDHTPAELQTELRRFSAIMKPLVAALAVENKKLLAQHKARNAAAAA